MTLLIVVDMQNDFVTGALGTAEAQAIVPHVNAKIAAADAVVYTLDTHGEDYLATQEGKRLPVPHCIRGTWGHALADGLTVRAEAGRIEKPTFGSTALGELVRSRFAAGEIDRVEPGEYTCVLSPTVAGVFAHESFGHKSESDFMLGSETMRREWELGKQVGWEGLSILDSGVPNGSGYCPYDDEGTRARDTYLVKNGVLTGRLHSAATAAALDEAVTGNARAISFEFEPIVRMTSTWIAGGTDTFESLLRGAEGGLYIPDFFHGSGMSTFTIAPARAYRIRGGKPAEPVLVSVISGNVMQTLHQIDGATAETELRSLFTGGCGKMEQWPLRVAFGGPYLRVRGLKVQ